MYAAVSMWWQYGEGKTTQLRVKTTGVHLEYVSVLEGTIKKSWNFKATFAMSFIGPN